MSRFCNNIPNSFEYLDEYGNNVFIVICDAEITVIALFWFVKTVYNNFLQDIFSVCLLRTLYDILNY